MEPSAGTMIGPKMYDSETPAMLAMTKIDVDIVRSCAGKKVDEIVVPADMA